MIKEFYTKDNLDVESWEGYTILNFAWRMYPIFELIYEYNGFLTEC